MLQLDRDICTVVDTSFLNWLRDRFRDKPGVKNLVCYRVHSNNRFCVGTYVSRDRGFVEEWFSYADPSEIKPYHVSVVEYHLGTGAQDDARHAAQMIREYARNRKRREADLNQEEWERQQHRPGKAGHSGYGG